MSKSKINELKEDDSKFIQVYVREKPYLRYAPKKSGHYHAHLLESFLNSFKIIFETFYDKSMMGEIPFARGKDYELVGAGKVSRHPNGDLEFYDSSGSYHIGTHLKHLEEIFEDKKSHIEKINKFRYLVKFNNSQEDETSESLFNLKSSLNDDLDEVPF